MFLISIPTADHQYLHEGKSVQVTINGRAEDLHQEGNYLCYGENRCKIIDEQTIHDCNRVECIMFTCASHGMEDEQHLIIEPDYINWLDFMTKK